MREGGGERGLIGHQRKGKEGAKKCGGNVMKVKVINR